MNDKTLTLYEFDGFRVDVDRKCLWYSDELVSLTPKAFETLLVLIRHRGEIVEKDFLLDEVWADTFVEESTLSQNILTLRKTLDAFQKGRKFIFTIPRRGYRFVADVREIVIDEELFVPENNIQIDVPGGQTAVDNLNGAGKSELADAAKPVSNKAFSRKFLILGVVLSGPVILTASLLGLWFFWKKPGLVETKFQKFKISSLFSDANIRSAAISPDGKYLALVEAKNETESLLLRQIEGGNLLEIVPKLDGNFIGVTFLPESDYIFYAVYRKNESAVRQGTLYKMPILGGVPQQITKDIDSPVTVSPDKKRIAFVRRDRQEKETALIISDIDGTNERKLAVRRFGEDFLNAAFSPDGKFISCVANSTGNVEKPVEIIIVNAEKSGEQKSLTAQNWLWVGQTAWLKDGSGLIVVGYNAKSPNLTDEIWFVSFSDGQARLLEGGFNGIYGLSVTGDAGAIVAVKSSKITSFFVSPVDAPEKSQILLTKIGDESLSPLGAAWTPDGKIIYSTTNDRNADIWSINSDAGAGGSAAEQKQLTSDAAADLSPQAGAIGKFIYFLSNRSGSMEIWRMNADGADPQKITGGADVFSMTLSPDDKWIYYTARAGSIFTQRLWKTSADGRNTKLLSEKTVFSPKISPDGKMIACYLSGTENQNSRLTLLSADTGEVLRQIETPESDGLYPFEWKKDGQNLLLVVRKDGVTSLWLQPVDGASQAKKLKDWANETIFRIAVSKDGEKFFYEKGVTANNVMLLSDDSSPN